MPVLLSILTTARLTRASVALGAVADVWLVVLLTRALGNGSETGAEVLPLWFALAASALMAAGFFTFGCVLNDLLDAKRDRALSPERPIPAGLFPPRDAVLLASGCLLCGILGALGFGSRATAIALLLALAILIYDAAAKYVPAARLVLFGALTGISMLVPNGNFPYAIILAVAMLQSIATATAAYMVEGKRPQLTPRAKFFLVLGVLLMLTATFAATYESSGSREFLPSGMTWQASLLPASIFVAGCIYLHFAARVKCEGDEHRKRGDRIYRRGALWRAMTASAWLLAAGLAVEAALLATVASLGFGAMAVLRSLVPAPDAPPKWR